MNIHAKKTLGQNFLKSKRVLEKMVEVSDLSKKDLVLEVGPGKGALTQKILDTGAQLVVIEKDHRMMPVLEQKFTKQISAKQLQIVEGDALQIDYESLGFRSGKFKVIANLPYYITGKFLSNVLGHQVQPSMLVLMLQKAVVERIIPNPREKKGVMTKESILSLSVKVYGKPEFVMPVSAQNFSPVPKVDSAVLKVSEISKDFFADMCGSTKTEDLEKTEEDFFSFLKRAFASKRKKIIKNLTGSIKNNPNISRENMEHIFQDLRISKDLRAEELTLEEFREIFKKIQRQT